MFVWFVARISKTAPVAIPFIAATKIVENRKHELKSPIVYKRFDPFMRSQDQDERASWYANRWKHLRKPDSR